MLTSLVYELICSLVGSVILLYTTDISNYVTAHEVAVVAVRYWLMGCCCASG